MKLATVLTPLSEENLVLAAQCGVQGVTVRYPGPALEDVLAVKQTIEDHGMEVVAIEGFLPIEKIKTGTDEDGIEVRAIKDLIRHMGTAGIPVLCYNFMAGTDWVRTRIDAEARGGARVTAFDLVDAERAVSLNSADQGISTTSVSSDELWTWLERFLREVIPVAEECQVMLAMHPDDPPLTEFHGKSRILNSVAGFERLVSLVPSPCNAICFCLGTFVEMGVDIPATIRRLGSHIRYVHFRDVEGTADSFVETFHDNGPTNMAAVVRALREMNYTGPIRPDHVPQLYGEDTGEPGYTMLGRLFAFGYIRGLLQATEPD
ncbi:MAG: mannonate dehydratase [Fuerstiella sp.]|nr:mannonate dehydratase [Fuerstiella sp.]